MLSKIDDLYPLFLLHTFMAYGSKIVLKQIFGGVSKPLRGVDGKIFFKVNTFFILLFIEFWYYI